jgi:hypothetical protein
MDVLDNLTLLKTIYEMTISDVFTGNPEVVQEQIINMILKEKTVKMYEIVDYLLPAIYKKFEFEIDCSKFDMI